MDSANDAARAASLIGSTLVERYRLDAVLGAGWASAMFRATDLREGTVAIKVFYPESMRGDAGRRFLHESSALLMLRHPHLVETLGAGTDTARGLSFMARPLLNARSADRVLAQLGVLDPIAATRIALHAARGVNAAHQVGVLHRNLKPENLFLELRSGEPQVVRVCDLGTLRLPTDVGPNATTPPNELQFSPDYLAPEQLTPDGSVDERTDVWGLGAVLYQMLSGSPPFGHLELANDVVTAITSDDAPHVQDRAPWLSPELALVVHRALSRDPGRRYATLEDFANALRPLAAGDETLGVASVTTVPAALREQTAARADILSEPPPPTSPRPRLQNTDEIGLIGRRLDSKFRAVRLIGRGGMGAVYEVEDDQGQHLAAKVISKGLAGENHPALVRFAREAKATSAIHSPNVVRTLDAGTDEELGLPYIIMELLHGTDLSSVLKREGALDPLIAVRVVLQGARGIAAAHAHNVIHRDIKPANLFLQVAENTGEVTVKVCDFGVAKRTRLDETRGGRTGGLSLTRAGGMLGSPMYMSPEQARNAKDVDERADVWSLAVVLWEALSGKRLWGQQSSLGELIVAICTEPLRRLEDMAPWVPRELARLVHKGLERDLAQRIPNMQAFIAELEGFGGGTDHVNADQLVGLTPEHREALAKHIEASTPPRAVERDAQRPTKRINHLPPPTPLPATDRSSGGFEPTAPKPGNNAVALALIVSAVIIGVALAVFR